MTLDIIAAIGTLSCIACAIPQLILTFKQGNIKGISKISLYLACFGAAMMTIYALCLPLPIYNIILQLYSNILCSVQLYYCFFPRVDP
jgi:uncharacterized protein with PQ loop repeat